MAMIYDNNTIVLRATNESKYLEGVAGEVIYPGRFVKWVGSDTVMLDDGGIVLASSGSLKTHIAVENKFDGSTIETPYEIGSRVMVRVCLPGDLVLALAYYATTIDVIKGAPLVHLDSFFPVWGGVVTIQEIAVPDDTSVFAYNYETTYFDVSVRRRIVEIA